MQLRAEDIATKQKVGTLEGKPVFEISTTGGFWMLLVQKSQGAETIGTGSHKCVSRHIASKRYPELRLTSLEKSDFVELVHFQHLLPKYEALTDRFRNLKR